MTRNDLSNIRFGFLHRWDSSNNSNNWIHVQTIYINRKITIMWRQRALFSFLVFLQFCTWSTEKDEENSWVVSLQNNKDENKWWPQLYKGLQAGNRWKANIQLLLGRICQRANYRRTSFTNTRDASFKLHLYCRVSISEGRLPLWRGWLRWGGRSRSVAKNVNAVIMWSRVTLIVAFPPSLTSSRIISS